MKQADAHDDLCQLSYGLVKAMFDMTLMCFIFVQINLKLIVLYGQQLLLEL
jgi:hypothetical protein